MSDALLAAKLHLPPLRSNLVSRRRLTAKLDRTLACKVTLIAAPAGFGKTTLVRAWIETSAYPVAWLSLDRQDNNLRRFLLYLIHAFRQIEPEFGAASLALLTTAHRPNTPTLLTQLSNDLAALSDPAILVLDDYQVIDDPEIHRAMDTLIAHLPPHLHLIIASRNQPLLTLARLRGQGQLLELTSADLRFTAVEAEQFLKNVMHLNLSPAERSALEMRTEGWVAGLQLAGLSLQTQEDKPAFIATFSGSNRLIDDYLFEEVLQHQPEQIQQFLLNTSVVDSLCSDLCDALVEQSGSQQILEMLERQQLFIIPLDNQRRWYRYHHLFSDLLRHHLHRTAPEQIPALYGRASIWFEQHGHLDDAIRHELKAKDFERAAELLDTAFEQRDWVQHDMHRLLTWFEALPENVVRSRPRLELACAWLLFEIFSDRWHDIDNHLRHVEETLTVSDTKTSFTEDEIPPMLAGVDLLRANHARQSGRPTQVIELCRQALNRLPADEMYMRSGAMAHLAAAYEDLGNMAKADELFSESIHLCRAANNIDGLLFAAARLIEVLNVGGQLRRAEKVFAQIRSYTETRTGPDLGAIYISIGQIYREQNRLEAAKRYLHQGLELCRPFEAWQAAVTSGTVSMARLLAAEGHLEQAMTALLEPEKLGGAASPSEQARLESVHARLLLAQGNFNSAARWTRRGKLSTIQTSEVKTSEDFTDYTREFDHLTLARILIAQASLEKQGVQPARVSAQPLAAAIQLLEHLHRAALSGGRLGRVIEIRLLQALAHSLQHKTAAALSHLQEALELAEPEGYIRLFVDEGWPLFQLLTLLLTKHPTSSTDYIQTLLDAFPPSAKQSTQLDLLGETLTERELATLRLLATEMSTKEIAAELTVSVSTVRTYAKRIYGKLNVHSRAEAVYRAKALKLL